MLYDGKLLPDHVVDVHFGDERYSSKKMYAQVKSDAAGRIAVKLDRPGIYLAMTRHRLLPASAGVPATSHTYSITFEATDEDALPRKAPLIAACLLPLRQCMRRPRPTTSRSSIVEYDLNHDGSVAKEELADERERRFIATDADHDGGLTHDEYVGEYRTRLVAKNPDAKTVERQMK